MKWFFVWILTNDVNNNVSKKSKQLRSKVYVLDNRLIYRASEPIFLGYLGSFESIKFGFIICKHS